MAPGDRRRFILLAALVCLFAAAWYGGVLGQFRDVEALRQLIAALGPRAYIFFAASFILLHPLGVPAFFWVIPAGIVWPFWTAFPLSLAAILAAASVGFLLARYLARDWVAARLPPRLRQFDERLARHGTRAVILIRLLLLPSPPTHWALGLSMVGYLDFAVGTALGSIPSIAAATWLGEHALEWLGASTAAMWLVLVVLVVAGLVLRRLA